MSLKGKTESLQKLLKELPAFVIAFSGGVDSGLLAATAAKAGIQPLRLITVRPPWVPEREYRDAAATAASLGAEWNVIPTKFPKELIKNPENRCYRCKKRILTLIKKAACSAGASLILDGSNTDDSRAYRPGKKALKEFSVRSPLAECGFSKEDVRTLAKECELSVWNKPAYSCLLTRFPHNRIITAQMLTRVEKGEEFLIESGFPEVRLRSHEDLARIELTPEAREKFCTPEIMDTISHGLKEIGYRYVSLELEGYRSGNMDKAGRK